MTTTTAVSSSRASTSSNSLYSRKTNTSSSHDSLAAEQRSVSSVSTARTLADLPFTTDLPLYRRKDLEIGDMLGRGRFSQVHAVDRIRHRHTTTTTSTTSASGDKDKDSNNAQKTTTFTYTEHRFVMKHIQNKLFANRMHRRCAKDLTSAVADLVTEAMYLTKLRHPHIVQLRGLTLGGTSVLKRKGAVGGDYFLLLDRMEETLDQRIQLTWKKMYATGKPQSFGKQQHTSTGAESEQQPKKEQQHPRQPLSLVLAKTRYAWQMADALSYLHDHQILYRDLKPENVGFTLDTSSSIASNEDDDKQQQHSYSYKLQLFDFGLARELDEPATNESKLYALSASGTRRYMAPETFNPPGKYNYKADVYSWAMVVYEMMSHIKPFALFTCQLHEELVCRLGGRPRMKEIQWPAECCVGKGEDKGSMPRRLAKDLESLMHHAWNQKLDERLTMAQVCRRVQAILQEYDHTTKTTTAEKDAAAETSNAEQSLRLSSHLKSLSQEDHGNATTTTAGTGTADSAAAVIIFQKKTSTSELTIATESMASDSEVDEDQPRARWSHSSARSSISSKGTLLVRE